MRKDLREINNFCRTFFLFILAGALLSCEPQEERIDMGFTGGLTFSLDTVFFDTLFTSRGSITKRFYVTNPHDKAVVISNISVGSGEGSAYRIAVNGDYGVEHENYTLLGNDSMLVLVEALIDPQDRDLPFLVKDSAVFITNGQVQDVKLIAWGQDAHFLGNEILDCNTTWVNDKPYVLYKSILVDSLCSLHIKKGVRVFCAPNTFIYVKGTLNIEGSAKERVVVRNDRFEPKYENALGQWGGIVFLEGSHDNRITFATIRNGQTALRVGTPDTDTIPDLAMKNVIVENMSGSGILAFTSDVYADNTLINNCREFVVGNFAGGNYTYVNCTFANYSFDFIRETPASVFTNYLVLEDNSRIDEDLSVALVNSIVHGDLSDEILLDFSDQTVVTLFFRNNLLKTTIEDLDINFNLINEDPAFRSPFNYEFQIDSLSPAVDSGFDVGLEIDLDSAERDDMPDMGAYEFKPQQ